MREPAPVSIDAALGHHTRAALREVLDEVLAPIRRDLELLKQSAPPALVDITEICERLHISPATARRWATTGQIRTVKRGRVIRYDLASLRPADDTEVAKLAAQAREGR